MRSKSWQAALTGASIIAVLSVGVRAQQSPRELFERAKLLEQSGRQSARVVAMYEEVATKADRALAAAARLQIALLKEREGHAEARALYAAIIRDYPDQRDVVSKAQSKLAARTAGRGGRSDVVARKVLEGGWAAVVDISANGRTAIGWERAGYSSRNLVARDMETGKETLVVAGGPSGTPGMPRISADGRRVAYNWNDMDDGTRSIGRSLRVIALEAGANPEILLSQADRQMRPSGWSPDGKRLLVNVNRAGETGVSLNTRSEIGWVSLDDRSYTTLKTFEPWQNHFPERLSPDGRFVAYATEPREGSTDHYVYVFDTVSLRETAIVTAAGSREAPVWTSDGGHLLYKEGEALKSVAVLDGQPAGEPRILHNGFSGMAIGVTAAGTFQYSNDTGGGNYHFIVPRTPSATERPLTFAGLGSSWSPDGRQVAFVRGSAMAKVQLVIRDLQSGEERSYPRQGLSESPRWLPDGKSVIVVATDRVGGSQRAGFYKVDLSTGQEVRLFDRDANGRSRTGVASLSPDGKTLYLGVHANQDAPVTGIVAVDLATGEERQVVTFTSADRSNDLGIAVSPDGNTLAVTAWTKAYATARLFTVGTNGSGSREVVGSFATGWLGDKLRWTPDGRSLVFTVFDTRKNWRIMRVAADGGTPEFDGVSYDVISSLLPSFKLWSGNFNNIDLSPDGSRIITSALTSAKFEIWTLDGLMNAVNSR